MLRAGAIHLDFKPARSIFVRTMAHTPYSLNKLGNLIDDGYRVLAICHARLNGRYCENSAELDLEELARRYGRDFKLLHRTIAWKLRCTRCGARGQVKRGGPISLQLQLPETSTAGNGDAWAPPPGRE